MNPEERALARVEHQRDWHDKKAIRNKTRYYLCEIATLASGAMVFVLNVISLMADKYTPWITLLSTILGAIVVLVVGAQRLCRFQENWLSYRTIAEGLVREKQYYHAGVGDYDEANQDRLKTFVIRTEDIVKYGTLLGQP